MASGIVNGSLPSVTTLSRQTLLFRPNNLTIIPINLTLLLSLSLSLSLLLVCFFVYFSILSSTVCCISPPFSFIVVIIHPYIAYPFFSATLSLSLNLQISKGSKVRERKKAIIHFLFQLSCSSSSHNHRCDLRYLSIEPSLWSIPPRSSFSFTILASLLFSVSVEYGDC